MSLEQKVQDDIAKRARSYAPLPKAESWEQIQAQLAVPPRKRRSFFWLWLPMGIVAIFLGYVGFFILKSESSSVLIGRETDEAAIMQENLLNSEFTEHFRFTERSSDSVLTVESNLSVQLPVKHKDNRTTTELLQKPLIIKSHQTSTDQGLKSAELNNTVTAGKISIDANIFLPEIAGEKWTDSAKSKITTESYKEIITSHESSQNADRNNSAATYLSSESNALIDLVLDSEVQDRAPIFSPQPVLLDLRAIAQVVNEGEQNLTPLPVVSTPHKASHNVMVPELSLVLSAGWGSHQIQQAAKGNEPLDFPISTLVAQSSLVNTTYSLGIEACFKNGLIVALGLDHTQLAWTAGLEQPDRITLEPIPVGDLFTGQTIRYDTMVTTESFELRRSTKEAYFSGYAGLGYRYGLGRWNLLALGNVHHGRLAQVNGTLFADQSNNPGSFYDNLQLNSSAQWWWSARAGAEVQMNARISLRATFDWRQRLEQPELLPGSSSIVAMYGGSLGVRFVLRE